MANKIQRAARMNHSFVFRCTLADKAAIESAADNLGMNSSQLLRHILIKEKILHPSGVSQEDSKWV